MVLLYIVKIYKQMISFRLDSKSVIDINLEWNLACIISVYRNEMIRNILDQGQA